MYDWITVLNIEETVVVTINGWQLTKTTNTVTGLSTYEWEQL